MPPIVRARRPLPPAAIYTVAAESELGAPAAALSRRGAGGTNAMYRRLLELHALSTPTLFIHVATGSQPCRLVLEPWDRRHVAFSGEGWTLMAGAESAAGLPAYAVPEPRRRHRLYKGAPSHPLFVVSMRHAGEPELRGFFPGYVTHVTVMGDSHAVATAQRLAHDQGKHVFHLGGRAA